MTTKQRYEGIIAYFQQAMPVAESELNYNSPFELLVAVILSAQCTDKRVNMVTPALFTAYPTVHALAQTTVEEVLSYIKSVSYPNSKAQHLVEMAKRVVEVYDGIINVVYSRIGNFFGIFFCNINRLWFWPNCCSFDVFGNIR